VKWSTEVLLLLRHGALSACSVMLGVMPKSFVRHATAAGLLLRGLVPVAAAAAVNTCCTHASIITDHVGTMRKQLRHPDTVHRSVGQNTRVIWVIHSASNKLTVKHRNLTTPASEEQHQTWNQVNYCRKQSLLHREHRTERPDPLLVTSTCIITTQQFSITTLMGQPWMNCSSKDAAHKHNSYGQRHK